MMKTEYIYYKTQTGYCSYYVAGDPTDGWRTKAEILEKIAERNETIISEQEYNEYILRVVSKKLKTNLEAENIGEVFDQLMSNENIFSFQAFETFTGVHLDKTWKRRRLQLIEYFGDKYTAWQEEEQRKAEEKEQQRIAELKERKAQQTNTAEERYKSGMWITGEDFLLLCDKYSVNMHPRTRGFCKQKVKDINNKHQICIPRKTKYPQGVSDALQKLDRALAIA